MKTVKLNVAPKKRVELAAKPKPIYQSRDAAGLDSQMQQVRSNANRSGNRHVRSLHIRRGRDNRRELVSWFDGDGADTVVLVAVVLFAVLAFLLGDGVR